MNDDAVPSFGPESRVSKGPSGRRHGDVITTGSVARAHCRGRDLGSAWQESYDKNEKQVLDSGTTPLSSAPLASFLPLGSNFILGLEDFFSRRAMAMTRTIGSSIVERAIQRGDQLHPQLGILLAWPRFARMAGCVGRGVGGGAKISY